MGGVKLKKIITLLLTVLALTACAETTKYDYKFTGASEHWEAEYANKGTEVWGEKDGQRTYANEDSYEFLLEFKGDSEEMSSIKKVEYTYKTSSGEGKGTEEFTESNKVVVFSSKGSSNGAKIGGDEVIQVNVKWDDFEESFELRNNSK